MGPGLWTPAHLSWPARDLLQGHRVLSSLPEARLANSRQLQPLRTSGFQLWPLGPLCKQVSRPKSLCATLDRNLYDPLNQSQCVLSTHLDTFTHSHSYTQIHTQIHSYTQAHTHTHRCSHTEPYTHLVHRHITHKGAHTHSQRHTLSQVHA